jgi:protein involved in polysaccharide export with SLBB domain
MTLAEAVAAAGGLLDLQADPGSVFLYRREPHANNESNHTREASQPTFLRPPYSVPA